MIKQAIDKNPTIARAVTNINRAETLLQQARAFTLPIAEHQHHQCHARLGPVVWQRHDPAAEPDRDRRERRLPGAGRLAMGERAAGARSDRGG